MAPQYEETRPGAAVAAATGDLLVLRATMIAGDANALFVPNGEEDPSDTARPLMLDIPQ